MSEREHFDRVVAIGDLDGAVTVLREILQGTEIIDRRGRWVATRTLLVQLGDVFNRGSGAREAFLLLRQLMDEAPRSQSRVVMLLGNHEVMTALRNEAYCTVEEYLSFATDAQREAWARRVERAHARLYWNHPPGGPILPLRPRLDDWKIRNVPGRAAMRRALGPRGEIGHALRVQPVVAVAAGCAFSHAPIAPSWARLGVDGLNREAREAWGDVRFYGELPVDSILRDADGPLWNRHLVATEDGRAGRQLGRSLARLGVDRMVVGHTQTGVLPGGEAGRIALRHGGRLVCIDVGLGRLAPSSQAVLVIEGGRGLEWTPAGTRELWSGPPRRPLPRRPAVPIAPASSPVQDEI